MEMSFLNNYELPAHLCCKYGVNQVLTAAVSLSDFPRVVLKFNWS